VIVLFPTDGQVNRSVVRDLFQLRRSLGAGTGANENIREQNGSRGVSGNNISVTICETIIEEELYCNVFKFVTFCFSVCIHIHYLVYIQQLIVPVTRNSVFV